MAKKDTLREYHAKGGHPRFVVQRHDASSPHFDFRLEIGDVLVSWSVPKGPSLNPGEKRLAIRTEDHPLDYVDYEGRIPEGESLEDGLDRGTLKVLLDGEKVRGAFTLARTAMGGGRQEQWLLIKKDDRGADRRREPAETEPGSVLSGRTNEDLA